MCPWNTALWERRKRFFCFFSIWVFFHEHSRITGLQGRGEDIYLTSHYHFHLLHRQLDISWAITAESSPLHIASSRTRTGNLSKRKSLLIYRVYITRRPREIWQHLTDYWIKKNDILRLFECFQLSESLLSELLTARKADAIAL